MCRIHPNPLEYTSFGKPSPLVFQNAELVLKKLLSSVYSNSHLINHATPGSHNFKTLYMVGDNPSVDIKGARQVCLAWARNEDSYFYIFLIVTTCFDMIVQENNFFCNFRRDNPGFQF